MQFLCFMDDSRKTVPKVRDGKIHFICSKTEIGKILKSVSICSFIMDITNQLSCKVSYHWMLNGIHNSINSTRCIRQFYSANFETFCIGKKKPNVVFKGIHTYCSPNISFWAVVSCILLSDMQVTSVFSLHIYSRQANSATLAGCKIIKHCM